MTVHDALQIATAHHRDGRLAEAEAIYRRILAEYPDEPDTLHLLGVAEHQRGRHLEAVVLLERATSLQPGTGIFQVNLSAALGAAGQSQRALVAAERAVACDPHLAEAHHCLAVARRAEENPEGAEEALARALQLRPAFPEAHCELGNVFAARGDLAAAIAAYREALRHRPAYAEAHYNLANMLWKTGDDAGALSGYRTAVQLRPDYADAWFNFGNALHGLADLDGAAAAYDACLQVQPEYGSALWHRGNVSKDRGELTQALTDWRAALTLMPNDAALHSTLVLYLRYDPGTAPGEIAAAEAEWNRRHVVPLRSTRPAHAHARTAGRPLRLGYVSADLWDHAVGRNLLPLLAQHDRSQFEVHCYSSGGHADAMTERLRRLAHGWREVAHLSDDQLADQIRADGIDVLVDLSLHTGGHRLLAFARQPAPVQFSFAGYPGRTGVETIAHRISDPHLEAGEPITEGTHCIPSFWCFDPIDETDEVGPLPALEAGCVTFGCLNHPCKTNDAVLAQWARVLHAVPASRLHLLRSTGRHCAHLLAQFAALGIGAERVALRPPAPRAEYLRYFHRIDLTLDTFPYSGHTTSLESLWMGVPVVTRPGATIVSRGGASQLRNLGLPELIARDGDDFVRIAVELAQDLPRLSALRRSLRQRMRGSPLMDATAFARGIEHAFRTAWRQWCEAPSSR